MFLFILFLIINKKWCCGESDYDKTIMNTLISHPIILRRMDTNSLCWTKRQPYTSNYDYTYYDNNNNIYTFKHGLSKKDYDTIVSNIKELLSYSSGDIDDDTIYIFHKYVDKRNKLCYTYALNMNNEYDDIQFTIYKKNIEVNISICDRVGQWIGLW